MIRAGLLIRGGSGVIGLLALACAQTHFQAAPDADGGSDLARPVDLVAVSFEPGTAGSRAGVDARGPDVSAACQFGQNELGSSFLVRHEGCAERIDDVLAACRDHTVKRTRCAGYIELQFVPTERGTPGRKYQSECYYDQQSGMLLGGWWVDTPYVEDAFPTLAGTSPVNCEKTCTTAETLCAPRWDAAVSCD